MKLCHDFSCTYWSTDLLQKEKREEINAELGVLTFAVPKDLVSLQIKNYFFFVCHCV